MMTYQNRQQLRGLLRVELSGRHLRIFEVELAGVSLSGILGFACTASLSRLCTSQGDMMHEVPWKLYLFASRTQAMSRSWICVIYIEIRIMVRQCNISENAARERVVLESVETTPA